METNPDKRSENQAVALFQSVTSGLGAAGASIVAYLAGLLESGRAMWNRIRAVSYARKPEVDSEAASAESGDENSLREVVAGAAGRSARPFAGWIFRSVEEGRVPFAGIIGSEASRVMPDLASPGAARGCGVLFLFGVLILAAGWGGGLGWFVWQIEDTRTKIEALSDFQPKMGSKFFSSDEVLLGEYSVESRRVLRLDEIPLRLQKAFLATEDDKFYEHRGVRPDAIANAFRYIVKTGRMRGGSTITQQMVRNVEPLPVGQSRTLQRKVTEAIISLQVERRYTKDEILELYLNQLFLGGSAYGVEAASQQYFGKSCQEVTVAEAAMLAGLARSPNNNRPDQHPENARARRRIVLRQMLANEFITSEELAIADAESLIASLQTDEELAASLSNDESAWRPNEFLAPYFCEATRIHLRRENLVNKVELLESGLEIYTTIDLGLQEKVLEIVEVHLQKFDDNKLNYLRRAGREEEFVPVSGALVLIDNRPGMEGFVRAMFGGRDFEREQFNTATQAKRQPGSSVKPFVWTTAMKQGLRPSSMEMDAPVTIRVGRDQYWSPRNFGGGYGGATSLRRALERSVNIVSVRLVQRYGLSAVRDTLQQMGIRTPIPDGLGLTIALGSLVVSPLEHCVAYSTFANGGVYYPPVLVSERRNRDGITEFKARPKGNRVLDENIAYLMTNIMEGVAIRGTGARSRPLERPRGGKTGTTNDARDVWFCGFTPQFTCVVWIGYRDYRSLGAGREFTGGRLACPIWTEVMIEAHHGLPVLEFDVPPNIAFHGSGPGFREAYLKDSGALAPAPSEEPGPLDDPGSVLPGAGQLSGPENVPQTPEDEEKELEDLFGPLFEGFNT